MTNTMTLRGVLGLLLALGVALISAGVQLRYYGRTGPGPGFFPIWVGSLLSASCLWALVGSFIDAPDRTLFIASKEACLRVGAVLAGLCGALLLLELLGFRLAILLFALFVPPILDRQHPLTVAAVAILLSFGTAYAFENWLGVWLPRSSIETLANFGF
jgi:putative tricarboxylic transport membrane protein